MRYELTVTDRHSGRVERKRFRDMAQAKHFAKPYITANTTAQVYQLEVRDLRRAAEQEGRR